MQTFSYTEESWLCNQSVRDPVQCLSVSYFSILGDISKAVELITKALELDEKCEFAYETLGTIEVQRGNLKRAIELFDKAIPLANTELEMGHLFGLRDAAQAQITVSTKLNISLPPMGM